MTNKNAKCLNVLAYSRSAAEGFIRKASLLSVQTQHKQKKCEFCRDILLQSGRFGHQNPSRALKAGAHAHQNGDHDEDQRSHGESWRNESDTVQV